MILSKEIMKFEKIKAQIILIEINKICIEKAVKFVRVYISFSLLNLSVLSHFLQLVKAKRLSLFGVIIRKLYIQSGYFCAHACTFCVCHSVSGYRDERNTSGRFRLAATAVRLQNRYAISIVSIT